MWVVDVAELYTVSLTPEQAIADIDGLHFA